MERAEEQQKKKIQFQLYETLFNKKGHLHSHTRTHTQLHSALHTNTHVF